MNYDSRLERLLVLFLKFSWVGALATLLHFLLLGALVGEFAVDPVIASSAAFCCAALLNYFLNYHYTFRSIARHSSALPKFMVIASVGLISNAALMFVFASALGLHYWFAQAIATCVVLVWNFIGNSLWSFGAGSDEPLG